MLRHVATAAAGDDVVFAISSSVINSINSVVEVNAVIGVVRGFNLTDDHHRRDAAIETISGSNFDELGFCYAPP
jgi:hypothetical protein